MIKTHIDFETHSQLALDDVGAPRYSMDPSTDVMCMAISFGDGPTRVLTRDEVAAIGRGFPVGHVSYNLSPLHTLVEAHNAHFEYFIYNNILVKRYGWPALSSPKNWDCTMARGFRCGLPGSLAGAAAALRLPIKKDLEGRAIMLKLARPRKDGSFITEAEEPELFKRLYAYCGVDVDVEKLLDKRLPELTADERKIWELDLTINARGITADLVAAKRAKEISAVITTSLNSRLQKLSHGVIDKATQLNAMKRFLFVSGVYDIKKEKGKPDEKTEIASLDKVAIPKLLARPDVPEVVKEIVKIRQQVGKSSTAKYDSMLKVADPNDHRMRGLLQYHAASTGRWGGRLVQPQNFPKGIGFKADKVIDDVLAYSPDLFDMKYGNKAMDALSAGLRGAMTAAPGKVLVQADYASIEARVLFWLAGEDFALAKYKMGVNLYVDLAKEIYGDPAITKETHAKEYAVGKEGILGSGYGMGWAKFMARCRENSIILDTQEPSTVWCEELKRFYTKEEAKAQLVIKTYRAKYKKVVQLWYAMERAAVNAVQSPGKCFFPSDPKSGADLTGGKILFGMGPAREYLVMRLPSGRHLRYLRPSLKTVDGPYGEKAEIHYWASFSNSDAKYAVEVDPSGYFAQYKTYGGSLVENAVQAIARDFMANGMLNVEDIGITILLTVHDELLGEVDEGRRFMKSERLVALPGSTLPDAFSGMKELAPHEAMIEAMCKLPSWGFGCPIAAEGWTGKRYRK
jgi:DNA polymerase